MWNSRLWKLLVPFAIGVLMIAFAFSTVVSSKDSEIKPELYDLYGVVIPAIIVALGILAMVFPFIQFLGVGGEDE